MHTGGYFLRWRLVKKRFTNFSVAMQLTHSLPALPAPAPSGRLMCCPDYSAFNWTSRNTKAAVMDPAQATNDAKFLIVRMGSDAFKRIIVLIDVGWPRRHLSNGDQGFESRSFEL